MPTPAQPLLSLVRADTPIDLKNPKFFKPKKCGRPRWKKSLSPIVQKISALEKLPFL